MPAVPDNVLNWLYSVLRGEYLDPNRTYSDTARVLSQYPSLSPRTDTYTYEHGVLALLLLLKGTIPVSFRGTTYRFPVAIWVPHAYPREAPLVYVTPTEGMLARPGQHVSSDGRVYHPYLAKWAEFWDKSSLTDLVAILIEIFAKEPPVISRQDAQNRPVVMDDRPPPPVPPPPEEWRRSQQPQAQVRSRPPQQRDGGPPPLPPKGADSMRPSSMSPANGRVMSPNQGPPLPPLPPIHTQQQQRPPSQQYYHNNMQAPSGQGSHPARQSSIEVAPSPYRQDALPPHMRTHEMESPISPVTPAGDVAQRPFHHSGPQYQPNPQQQQMQSQTPQSQQQGYPPGYPAQQQAYRPGPPPPHYQNQGPPVQQYQQAPQAQIRLLQPQIDLLSSPLDVQLPGQGGANAEPLPVPPVPPNPQKDMLLHAISQALVSQTNQTITNNSAALQSLTAQREALLQAHATLQAELDTLAHLNSALDANELSLRTGIQQIDTSIVEASRRRKPEIDEILVCPSVVGQQVYNTVAEEVAAREVRRSLGRALDKGRIEVKAFVKEMRAVGREEFFRKAMGKKIEVGMGLESSGRY